MSLVGPRPLPIRDYEGFNEDWQRRRFSVKPGITCLWQVQGRSSISFEKWMELDLQYIDKWSLWLDLQILLQTIPAVLKGSGGLTLREILISGAHGRDRAPRSPCHNGCNKVIIYALLPPTILLVEAFLSFK